MKAGIDLDKVFEVAIQLEKTGAQYYRKAAGFVKIRRTSVLLVELARMEEAHVKVFSRLKSRILPPVKNDSASGTALSFIQAICRNYVFPIHMKVSDILTGEETTKEILDRAIKMETDSVAFYTGIREAMASEEDRKIIGRLIYEEQKHVVELVSAIETV